MKESVNLYSGRITPEAEEEFSIKEHEFSDYAMHKAVCANSIAVTINVNSAPWIALYKDDAIALAKHFKLNAHDIECQEYIALQKYYAQVEEDAFDNDAKLHAEIALLNQKLLMKKVS